MIDKLLVDALTAATIAHFRENEPSRRSALALASRRLSQLGYTDVAARQDMWQQAERAALAEAEKTLVAEAWDDMNLMLGFDAPCPDPVMHMQLERAAAQEKRLPTMAPPGFCPWCGGSTVQPGGMT